MERTKNLNMSEINMNHGAGGRAMRDLIESVFVATFNNPQLNALEDQARLPLAPLLQMGERLAITTDSYVVDPLFFPGGDIGSLAVNGTINDLAVGGAKPLYLTCAMILEEGMSVEELRKVVISMKAAADAAGVTIVTGDTKVVPKGKGDKVFINTTGVGVIPAGIELTAGRIEVGDKIIVNGYVGDHGVAILNARGDLALDVDVQSDSQPLHGLVASMLAECSAIRAMRDATRGGIATVLNEFAQESAKTFQVLESSIPVRSEVRSVCEILGLNPLYFANEGKLIVVVPAKSADSVLQVMRMHPAGKNAAIIGEVLEGKPRVEIKTALGASRILDMLVAEQLPRIC